MLRSVEPAALGDAHDAACYPLLPYSNRLGYRRFRWKGEDYTTRPNCGDGPHSLHGVGWRRPWQVVSSNAVEVVLQLRHDGDADWPFAFEASQYFALTPRALGVQMVFTNRAAIAQPAGLGWHPYFPKRLRSRLRIEASDRWDTDATQLPTRKVAQPGIDSDVAHLDFDHCFEGWQGAARIRDEKFSLQLTSSLRYLVVYTPQYARLLLRRAGQPRVERDPHGRPGRARPAQRAAGRELRGLDAARGRGRLMAADPAVRVAVATPALLGESPFWHPHEQALYYCDITGHRLQRFDPRRGELKHWDFDDRRRAAARRWPTARCCWRCATACGASIRRARSARGSRRRRTTRPRSASTTASATRAAASGSAPATNRARRRWPRCTASRPVG